MILPSFSFGALNDEWISGEIRVGTRCMMLFHVAGTFSFTVNFYGSLDGTTYQLIQVLRMGTGSYATFTQQPNVVQLDATGLTRVKLVVNPYTSGSCTVQPAIAYGRVMGV